MHQLGTIIAIVALAACSAVACSVIVFANRRHCADVEPIQVIELGLGDARDAGGQ